MKLWKLALFAQILLIKPPGQTNPTITEVLWTLDAFGVILVHLEGDKTGQGAAVAILAGNGAGGRPSFFGNE
jgi:hypothetical protein